MRIVGQKAYVTTNVYNCNMIVSDASTLILLARVSILRRFLAAFGKIIVPEEVAKEMTVAHSLDARMLEREIQEKSISVEKIRSSTDEITGQFRLDKGEAEAYVLYNELHARVILTDDGELIKLCKLFEIPFVNALAIVVRMFDRGLLTRDETCEYLRKLNDYGRYSGKVYNIFKEEAKCPRQYRSDTNQNRISTSSQAF